MGEGGLACVWDPLCRRVIGIEPSVPAAVDFGVVDAASGIADGDSLIGGSRCARVDDMIPSMCGSRHPDEQRCVICRAIASVRST